MSSRSMPPMPPFSPAVREGIAVLIVGIVVSAYVGTIVQHPYIEVGPIQQAWIEMFFWLFAGASGFIVFGKQTILEALDLVRALRGDDGESVRDKLDGVNDGDR